MITNVYIKQLFRILKKYGQVNFFKTHVTMEELQSTIVNYCPQHYFRQINREFLKHRMLFEHEISDEYDKFINNIYIRKKLLNIYKKKIYTTP